MRTALFSLLTVLSLMLAVAPAMADSLSFYSNGPYNGTTDAWTLNFGFAVSDSYSGNTSGSVTDIQYVYWDASSTDVVTTTDVQFGSTSFTGATTTVGFTNTILNGGLTNQYGYYLFEASWTGADIPSPTSGYMTLSNACSTSGCSVSNPIYWDENSGPSLAFENTLGSIPSEAFSLSGNVCCFPTPDASIIMLFGSGIFGLVGLRRKLTR